MDDVPDIPDIPDIPDDRGLALARDRAAAIGAAPTERPVLSYATPDPLYRRKMRGLKWSIGWDMSNRVFVAFTIFGPVLVLFLDELGLSTVRIGLVLSLMWFCHMVAPLVASRVARAGPRRVFASFWAARTVVIALLVFSPWVLEGLGSTATLWFVCGVILVFGLLRATAEVGYFPWYHEFVPERVRGRYVAVAAGIGVVVDVAALFAAGYVLQRWTGLGRFTALIGAGCVFGLIAAWSVSHVPGGAPDPDAPTAREIWRGMSQALRDRRLVRYLCAMTFVTFNVDAMWPFVALFMTREVGLHPGWVVWLETALRVGTFSTALLWGRAADRVGGKPALAVALPLLMLAPLVLLFIPRTGAVGPAIVVAAVAFFLAGAAHVGWMVCSNRLLYVSIVPADRKTPYLTLWYAWLGLALGVGSLAAGWVVRAGQGLHGTWGVFRLDPFTPLLLLGPVLSLVAWRILWSIPEGPPKRMPQPVEVTGATATLRRDVAMGES